MHWQLSLSLLLLLSPQFRLNDALVSKKPNSKHDPLPTPPIPKEIVSSHSKKPPTPKTAIISNHLITMDPHPQVIYKLPDGTKKVYLLTAQPVPGKNFMYVNLDQALSQIQKMNTCIPLRLDKKPFSLKKRTLEKRKIDPLGATICFPATSPILSTLAGITPAKIEHSVNKGNSFCYHINDLRIHNLIR